RPVAATGYTGGAQVAKRRRSCNPGMGSAVAADTPDPPGRQHGVILFDGTCAFCERSVIFIANRDPNDYFRFGASQSPQGAALLARHAMTRDTARSIVLIEDGQVYL